MTTTSKARALRIAAVFAACAAGDAQAGQSLSYLYSVRTPLISITTGVQLGNNTKVVANQHSAINVFAVTQIGSNDSAFAHQKGFSNTGNVVQVSPGIPMTLPSAP